MRAHLPAALAAAVLASALLAACGDTATQPLSVGDCTTADPTLVIEAVTPEKIDCSSKDAKSKVTKQTTNRADCDTPAVIKQGATYYCVAPHGKTFGSGIDKATGKGKDAQQQFQDRMDQIKKGISTQTAPSGG